MITAAARVAGVVGWPVRHSLSPLIHNAWIEASGLDAAYVPFAVPPERFEAFATGLRGGRAVAGLNVTLPYKTAALQLAQTPSSEALAAEAANVLLYLDEEIVADNTDGVGLLAAFAEQAPHWRASDGPLLVLGAGGAAAGAVPALLGAGAPHVRVAARNPQAAWGVAERWGDRASAWALDDVARAAEDVTAVINATSAGLNGRGGLPVVPAPPAAVFMDMVYAPLRTDFLKAAADRGRPVVDGLAMLMGQARPSFEAFFGVKPPETVDVRALCLKALGETG